MDITPLVAEGQQVIRSYAAGKFVISGVEHRNSVIVFPTRVKQWGYTGGASDLSVDDFQFLQDCVQDIDVLLVGCGARGEFLPGLKKSLRDMGLNADFMDTGAACRTYNVLMAEGRRVAAALIPL